MPDDGRRYELLDGVLVVSPRRRRFTNGQAGAVKLPDHDYWPFALWSETST